MANALNSTKLSTVCLFEQVLGEPEISSSRLREILEPQQSLGGSEQQQQILWETSFNILSLSNTAQQRLTSQTNQNKRKVNGRTTPVKKD